MSEPRPLGEKLTNWTPPPPPDGSPLAGRYAMLERLDADRHAEALHVAYSTDPTVWDYLPYGPFASAADLHAWIRQAAEGTDPLFYAITDLDTGRLGGVASYLRITPASGSIEVGHINFAPILQRSRAATEAIFLMMDWAFQAGYRRFEWKCNALNLPSRRAAERLGLSYEGVFRQATVVKGRNRDTAWFAAIDAEWPALRAAFDRWLDPSNFDAAGQQRARLGDLTRPLRVTSDPALA
jgi:RimJ/RimL family protein N-acetyltransferase